jgi:hypothetical protein
MSSCKRQAAFYIAMSVSEGLTGHSEVGADNLDQLDK